MPLVSGVCRAASAPMLSHGGSRLNASKPEANPKTSCPIIYKKNRSLKTKIKPNVPTTRFLEIKSPWKMCLSFFLFSLFFVWFSCERQKQKKLLFSIFLKIESPLKTVGPPGSLVGTKYIKNSREFFFNFLFFLKMFCKTAIPLKTRERKKTCL